MISKLLIIFGAVIILFLLIAIWALCKAASIRDRQDEEKRRPKCYRPNNNPYPLCVGNGSPDCQYCCLYEDMPEPPFD